MPALVPRQRLLVPPAASLAAALQARAHAAGCWLLCSAMAGPTLLRGIPLRLQEPEVVIKTPGTYTLLMVDPDAPSPHSPKHRSWLHWMVRQPALWSAAAGGWGGGRPWGLPAPPPADQLC